MYVGMMVFRYVGGLKRSMYVFMYVYSYCVCVCARARARVLVRSRALQMYVLTCIISTHATPKRKACLHAHEPHVGFLRLSLVHEFQAQRRVYMYVYLYIYVCIYIYIHICICISARSDVISACIMFTHHACLGVFIAT